MTPLKDDRTDLIQSWCLNFWKRPESSVHLLIRAFPAFLQAQCELWLHGLLPASSYLLSVQTVAYWGQKRLKSPKLQIVFTTITQRGKQGGAKRIKKSLNHEPPGEGTDCSLLNIFLHSKNRSIIQLYITFSELLHSCQHILLPLFNGSTHVQQKVAALMVVPATEVFIGDLLVSLVVDYKRLQLNHQTTHQQFHMKHVQMLQF